MWNIKHVVYNRGESTMTIYKKLLIQEFKQCKDLKTLISLLKAASFYIDNDLI